jgi:CoA:oxalate CoA-transferase
MKTRPLEGLTVLDFTRVYSGPWATLLLSDLGADVVKVEHPCGGDDSRTFGPLIAGTSGYFETLNRGKKSIAVDYKTAAGQDLLRRLAEKSDVLIENFRPGQMARYHLDYSTLGASCPALVYVSISGFGQSEASRGCYDVVAQAEGGLMGLTGLPDLPCKTGPAIADAISGLTAAVGLLAALLGRQRHGQGAYVDIAMADVLFACLENALADYDVTHQVPARQENVDHALAPFDCFRASDGWLVIGVGNDRLWHRLAGLIGNLTGDVRFATNAERVERYPLLRPIIQDWCRPQTVDAALNRLHAAGIPSGAVRSIDELACDPRLEARNMLVRLPLEDGASVLVPGTPIQIAGMEAPVYRRGPRLGEHTGEVLSACLGLSSAVVEGYRAKGIVGVEGRPEIALANE